MAQAVSRRPPTADARVRSRVSPCGICGGQNVTGTDFSPSTSVFPCKFYSTGAPLHGKTEKTNHLHHRVAQKDSELRCVRSFYCGTLNHTKILNNTVLKKSSLTPLVAKPTIGNHSNHFKLSPSFTKYLLKNQLYYSYSFIPPPQLFKWPFFKMFLQKTFTSASFSPITFGPLPLQISLTCIKQSTFRLVLF
jgi:hypothetical protein